MANEAVKKDQDKPRVDLVPVSSVQAAARAFGFGAKKYSPWNWMKGFEWLRLFGAVLRHLFAWAAGEEKDSESGLCHLDHALASLMMLQTHTELNLGTDDRYFKVVGPEVSVLDTASSAINPPVSAAHVPVHQNILYQWAWCYEDAIPSKMEKDGRSPKFISLALANKWVEGQDPYIQQQCKTGAYGIREVKV